MGEETVRVLIVDDDWETRQSLAALLSQSGMTVAVAESVFEARQIVEPFDPNVVISDLAMPDEDGFQFIRSIRAAEERSGRHLAAIAMTGLTEPHVRRRSLEAGFDRHFAKPVSPSAIVNAVRQIVAQSTAV